VTTNLTKLNNIVIDFQYRDLYGKNLNKLIRPILAAPD